MKLGDAFATIAQPVVRGIDAILGTDLQNCTGCKGRQARMNQFSDAGYDFFWARLGRATKGKEEGMDEYIITKRSTQTFGTRADNPEDAENNLTTGKATPLGRETVVSVQLKPQPTAPAAPVVAGARQAPVARKTA